MAKSGKGALRAYLRTLPEAAVREQVLELWDRFPTVRDYFASRFSAEGGAQVLERAKSKIASEFSTGKRNPSGKPAVARKIIAEFRCSQVRPEAVIDLLLFYVGEAIDFSETYGDEQPIRSIATSFSEALKLAEKEELINAFQDRFAEVVERSREVGWGLDDLLTSEWSQYEPWDDD
jgi:hypothetical protein